MILHDFFINRIQHIWLQLKLKLREVYSTSLHYSQTDPEVHQRQRVCPRFTDTGIPTLNIILFKTRKVPYQVIDSYCFVCTLESVIGIIKGYFNGIIFVFTKRQIYITVYMLVCLALWQVELPIVSSDDCIVTTVRYYNYVCYKHSTKL